MVSISSASYTEQISSSFVTHSPMECLFCLPYNDARVFSAFRCHYQKIGVSCDQHALHRCCALQMIDVAIAQQIEIAHCDNINPTQPKLIRNRR